MHLFWLRLITRFLTSFNHFLLHSTVRRFGEMIFSHLMQSFSICFLRFFTEKKINSINKRDMHFKKSEQDENLMLAQKIVWMRKNEILFRSGLFPLSISFVYFVIFILDLLCASNFISFALLLSSFYHSSTTNWHNGRLTVNKHF